MGRIGDIADLAMVGLLGIGGFIAYRAIKGLPGIELPSFELPSFELPSFELPSLPSPAPPEIPAGYIIEEQRETNWQAQTRDYRNTTPGTTKKSYHKPAASIIPAQVYEPQPDWYPSGTILASGQIYMEARP